jgi:cysteinyl-tRNA synthetase
MLKLFNSLGKKVHPFSPVRKKVVKIFTCGPSVYQRAHLGNFRTFLFEDILVRYLEYCGYTVIRGMNFTDIEDKAVNEARRKNMSLKRLTDLHIREFIREMKLLGIKTPDYLPRASESVHEAVEIIEDLLASGIAYWHGGNVYFDPLKHPDFGKLFGLDMSRWPAKKRRFHKDTYPGIQWNLGDFILWHGRKEGERYFWTTKIGEGRPSWNIQDPSMILKYFDETLSLYCGGYDNLFRHHDYTKAILEAVRPYPMAKYWLHCHHLYVNGRKMSKSKGNILYTETLRGRGYDASEIRFSLIYGHYRQKIHFSDTRMRRDKEKLSAIKAKVASLAKIAGRRSGRRGRISNMLEVSFSRHMDNDLDTRSAFDIVYNIMSHIQPKGLAPSEASGVIRSLGEIDHVLGVLF